MRNKTTKKRYCQVTGVYSAVQHKHSSTQDHAPYRWCSAPTGERIYGREKVRG